MRECDDNSQDGETGFGYVDLVGDLSDVEDRERQREHRNRRDNGARLDEHDQRGEQHADGENRGHRGVGLGIDPEHRALGVRFVAHRD